MKNDDENNEIWVASTGMTCPLIGSVLVLFLFLFCSVVFVFLRVVVSESYRFVSCKPATVLRRGRLSSLVQATYCDCFKMIQVMIVLLVSSRKETSTLLVQCGERERI